MRTLAVAALVVSASCTTPPETHQDALTSDAYYIIATPDCVATNDLESCAFELGFCTDGTYSMVFSLSGSAEAGTYTLDDGVASNALNGFEFDFTTQQVIEPGTAYTTPWSTASGDEDTLVVCGD